MRFRGIIGVVAFIFLIFSFVPNVESCCSCGGATGVPCTGVGNTTIDKCKKAISKAISLYEFGVIKAISSKCESNRICGESNVNICPDCSENPKYQMWIAAGKLKVKKKINRACAPFLGSDIGAPATCPGFGGKCLNQIITPSNLGECAVCITDAKVRHLVRNIDGFFHSTKADKPLTKCRKAIWKFAVDSFLSKPLPVSYLAKLCRVCGDANGDCTGSDIFTPEHIGFNETCQGGIHCGFEINDFQDILECTECSANQMNLCDVYGLSDECNSIADPKTICEPVEATPVPTLTPTVVVTKTPCSTLTATPIKTATPTLIATNTATPMATNTPKPTVTCSPTKTKTPTPTPTTTKTASPTKTLTPTCTVTPTVTCTPVPTPTVTPPVFPDCVALLQGGEIGDREHYLTGTHAIVKDEEHSSTWWIEGSDDVWTLHGDLDGSFLQCAITNDGIVIQTNWYRSNANLPNWEPIKDSIWGLGDVRYLTNNIISDYVIPQLPCDCEMLSPRISVLSIFDSPVTPVRRVKISADWGACGTLQSRLTMNDVTNNVEYSFVDIERLEISNWEIPLTLSSRTFEFTLQVAGHRVVCKDSYENIVF